MNALAEKLRAEFSRMRPRSRIAILTRVILAVLFVVAGLAKLVWLA